MLTIAYVLSALQLLALASPSPAPSSIGVKRVSLTRRQAHNSTAPADIQRITQRIGSTLAKYDVGFDSFSKNSGKPHPLSNNDASNITKRAEGTAYLSPDDNALWTGVMCAGTPLSPFVVGFDTGSASLLLVSSTCTSSDCQGQRLYNPSDSSTSVDRKQKFNLKVTDSETVTGNQYADTVRVAGLEATDQVLGAASSYPKNFNTYSFRPDGRMGMAYQSISAYKAPSFPQNLVSQGVTTEPVFAFRMGTGCELNIGGLDHSAYTGDLVYTPVTTKGFWQVNLDAVQANNKRSVGRISAIIDTGSPLIIGDRQNVDKLYATIPGSRALSNGLYSVPCDSIPTVRITVSGSAFDIDPDLFNQGPVSEGSSQCVGGIVAGPQSKPPQRFWSIGDVFLQNVYSVFDVGNNRVGFGRLV